MTIAGNLQDMSLPTLVQVVLQEGGNALIKLEQSADIGLLYLAEGQLLHAELTHQNTPGLPIQTGEEVVYELLNWKTGDFVIERDISTSQHTVHHSWDFLLMEGLRQLDESQAVEFQIQTGDETLTEMLSDLPEEDAVAIQNLVTQYEGDDDMASKSEQLKSILQDVVNSSADLTGAAIVDNDGLLLASVLNGSIDGDRVAAVSAGLISLAGRSAEQLGQGAISQTLIQAEQGNIIALRAGNRTSFVGLTSPGVNLGMAFLKCRNAVDAIIKAL